MSTDGALESFERPMTGAVRDEPDVGKAASVKRGWAQPAVRVQLAYLIGAAISLLSLGLLLPRDVTLHLFGHVKHVHDFGALVARNLAVPALILPTMFMIESVCVGWEHSSLRDLLRPHDITLRSDVVLFLLVRVTPVYNFMPLVLTLGFSEIAGDSVRLWLHDVAGIDLSLLWLPLPLALLGYMTVHTFLDYWGHRLQHTRLLWPIHRFHHSAQEFSLITADRIHPGDFSTIFFSVFLVGLFQVSSVVYLAYAAVLSALRFTIHSRIDTDFGWVGRYLVLSPGHHRAHHVADEAHSGGNFGLIPLWDVLFGTLRPAVSRSTPIGVDHPYRHGYWVFSDMLRDSRDFVRGFFTRRVS
jgi:sterol desaturase/sphingolipid hydroxylase (fatty acid hydroxylase superfamily)